MTTFFQQSKSPVLPGTSLLRVNLLHQLVVQPPQVDIEVKGGTYPAKHIARGPGLTQEEDKTRSTTAKICGNDVERGRGPARDCGDLGEEN